MDLLLDSHFVIVYPPLVEALASRWRRDSPQSDPSTRALIGAMLLQQLHWHAQSAADGAKAGSDEAEGWVQGGDKRWARWLGGSPSPDTISRALRGLADLGLLERKEAGPGKGLLWRVDTAAVRALTAPIETDPPHTAGGRAAEEKTDPPHTAGGTLRTQQGVPPAHSGGSNILRNKTSSDSLQNPPSAQSRARRAAAVATADAAIAKPKPKTQTKKPALPAEDEVKPYTQAELECAEACLKVLREEMPDGTVRGFLAYSKLNVTARRNAGALAAGLHKINPPLTAEQLRNMVHAWRWATTDSRHWTARILALGSFTGDGAAANWTQLLANWWTVGDKVVIQYLPWERELRASAYEADFGDPADQPPAVSVCPPLSTGNAAQLLGALGKKPRGAA